MLVSLSSNEIIIDDNSSLKAYQKNQLKFVWGYKKNDLGYKYQGNDSKNLLYKTVKYFNNQSIPFYLNKAAQDAINSIENKKNEFNLIYRKGQDYKQNRYNDEKLEAFTSYLYQNSHRKLKEHQIRAAKHLYAIQNGANFSVPGSGKTSVVLSVYEKLRQEGRVNKLFVIGPPSCFGPWKDEFASTIGRKANAQIFAGGDSRLRKVSYFTEKIKHCDLILTSFQTLLQDYPDVSNFLKISDLKIFLVIDEAHYIKRINGNWANVVLGLSRHAVYRCILTGTPMPKSYSDVFNLFDFLWPDNDLIDENTKIKIQQLADKNKDTEIKELLHKSIQPFFYRVKKTDLGLKPAVFHEPIILEMNTHEKQIYDAIENRIISFSKEDVLNNFEVVKTLRRGRIMRLRQCVSYPKLLTTAIEGYQEDLIGTSSKLPNLISKYDNFELPAKISFLLKFVQEQQNKNQKVIIWSNFIYTLKLIKKVFAQNDIRSEIIYGATPIEQRTIREEKTREKIIREFLDISSGLNVLIANPAALAESVSLHTSCHCAVYYDLSYNCAQYLQSLDRIHRVGGSETVDTHYYFLQYRNTIDQDILENLKQKSQKMINIIEEDLPIYDLSMDEQDENEEAYERLFGKK